MRHRVAVITTSARAHAQDWPTAAAAAAHIARLRDRPDTLHVARFEADDAGDYRLVEQLDTDALARVPV